MAHDDRLPHFHLKVFEVVLLEHAETQGPGHADRPRVGFLLSRKTAKERRLSCAVGADQSVTVAGNKPGIDILEENTTREIQSRSFGTDHGNSGTGTRLAKCWASRFTTPRVLKEPGIQERAGAFGSP
jgi:hypothetical protein